jgi:D-glycero-D-manno-heptose 1,7-bisphosphate phosphatase
MQAAVFLDRDGTIIEDTGYVSSPEQVKFLPGAIEAIKMLSDAGYKIIIISNQSGVARGLITEDMLQTIDKLIHRTILNGGAHVDGSYYCPHHPEHGVYPYRQACECRKPHTGLIKKAVKEHNLDLARSLMVGDHATDIETAERAGIKSVFVMTGHGEEEKKSLKYQPEHFAPDLLAAAKWITSHGKVN